MRCYSMWTRVIAKVLAAAGLYAIVLAGLSMRFSGQKNSADFNLTLGEVGIVTVLFVIAVAFVVTRPRQPRE